MSRPEVDVQQLQPVFDRSDRFHNSLLLRDDPVLQTVVKNSDESELPKIAVSAAQGKFLNLLARSICAKRILELGTLGGYSTTCLARALPKGGELVTLELVEKHAELARKHFALAGLTDKIQLIVGPAVESLEKMSSENLYDFIFVDADKQSMAAYYTHAKRLVRSGGIIFIDNVVREGNVANPEYSDPKVEGVRKALQVIKDDDDIEATTIATVGEKGDDGFMYVIKK